MRTAIASLMAMALAACSTVTTPATTSLIEEKSLASLSADLAAGRVTSEQLTRAYLARIETIDRSGPKLRSVIAVNPDAVAQARALDAERKAGRSRGPLHGVPILLKDNIETKELPTTAGSLALKNNQTNRDAAMSARLRAAGAVLIGKTNLSEWANFRSTRSISGWSAVGGMVRNPYALDRNACGSSSGSGAAAAASLAAATVGTETSGSVICPSSMNGLVGLKPTVGLVSRTGVVPISHTMDTPGPMARSVTDAAMLLQAMAGTDPADPATAEADSKREDYAAALKPDALRGKRLGVLRIGLGGSPEIDKLFERALADLKSAGAETVDLSSPWDSAGIQGASLAIMQTEFRADLAGYLATLPPAVTTRTLADLIAFNDANAATELPLFGQELFVMADKTKGLDDPAYLEQLEKGKRLAGPEGIDKVMAAERLDAIIAISTSTAPITDASFLSRGMQVSTPTGVPAVAGYPHLTVPMGLANGLPVGLSFIGGKWSEASLLAMGYAYEQAAPRRAAPTYAPTLNALPAYARAFEPAE